MQTFIRSKKQTIRVGSRTSELALKQTDLIINLLSQNNSDLEFKIVTMDTIGDKILDKELSKIGDKSLFTKELELALLAEEIDFVVHSLKDVPTALSPQFTLGCICLRESTDDAVVMKAGSDFKTLDDLPIDSIVGTSSVRRIAQMKHKFSHLKFASVRGNLNTRLKKLDSTITELNGNSEIPNYSALILAKTGLERIGLKHRISQVFSHDDSLYAVGQGALACECRSDDKSILKLLSSIHDDESSLTSIAERSLMRQLDGGCSTPIAVRSSLNKNGLLTLKASVMSVDGSECVSDEMAVLLPEEEIDTFLKKFKGQDHLVDDDGPPKKRSKRQSLKVCDITDKEIQLGKDASANFLGVRVFPICEIGRLRMAISQKLGAELARNLLAAGAKTILDGIQKTQPELKSAVENLQSKEIV